MSEEADETQLAIAEAIIQNLDDDGLLRVTLEDVAAMGPWPIEAVEKALALVQSLDPPGVGARSLSECLRIQLRVLGLEGSPADVMVRDHLKQLQSHQYPEIARQMGLSLPRRCRTSSRSSAGCRRGPATATARSAPTTSCPTCSWSRKARSTRSC